INLSPSTNTILTSTILSETMSRSVPKDDELLLFLAIAPSTASKYPDTQSKITALICISKYKNIEYDTPINHTNIFTLLGDRVIYIIDTTKSNIKSISTKLNLVLTILTVCDTIIRNTDMPGIVPKKVVSKKSLYFILVKPAS